MTVGVDAPVSPAIVTANAWRGVKIVLVVYSSQGHATMKGTTLLLATRRDDGLGRSRGQMTNLPNRGEGTTGWRVR